MIYNIQNEKEYKIIIIQKRNSYDTISHKREHSIHIFYFVINKSY